MNTRVLDLAIGSIIVVGITFCIVCAAGALPWIDSNEVTSAVQQTEGVNAYIYSGPVRFGNVDGDTWFGKYSAKGNFFVAYCWKKNRQITCQLTNTGPTPGEQWLKTHPRAEKGGGLRAPSAQS